MSANAIVEGPLNESGDDIIVWNPNDWCIGTNVAAYFEEEVPRKGEKRKRTKLFTGKVVDFAKASRFGMGDDYDALFHIRWEDNDSQDYDFWELEKAKKLFTRQVQIGKLPYPKSNPTTFDGGPYCVMIEGMASLPLHFLKFDKHKGHDDSIQFNSNDEEDCRYLFDYVESQLFLVSTKVTLMPGAPTISTAAGDSFALTVEAPLSKTANGPFRALLGGLAWIAVEVEPNSWDFRAEVIYQITVKGGITVRLLADTTVL